MRKIIFISIAIIFLCVGYVQAENVSFIWQKNTENDLAGYYLYQSVKCEDLWSQVDVEILSDASSCTVTLDNSRSYKWRLTAYDCIGLESDPSNIVGIKPPPPVGFSCLGIGI